MKLKIGFFCVALVFFVACGGGDGDSSTTETATPGSVDDMAAELADAAQDTAAQIVASESTGAYSLMGAVSVDSISDILKNTMATKQVETFSVGDVGAMETSTEYGSEPGECGGTAEYSSTSTTDDESFYPWEFELDYVYNDYCIGDGDSWVRFNGTGSLYWLMTDAENSTTSYEYDLTYTSNILFYTSGSIYFYEYCNTVDGVETCSVGVHDAETTTYYTSEVSVSGDASSGYDVSYYITDDDGHEYYIEFLDLIPCEDGGFSSGSGTVSYGSDVISVEFLSCDEFTVTYDGVVETFTL